MVAVEVPVPVPLDVRVVLPLPVREVALALPEGATLVELPVAPLVGGGASPWVGSVSAPVSHWMMSPFVAVWVWVGAVVLPVASAMVKRVVKSGSVAPGEVNL